MEPQRLSFNLQTVFIMTVKVKWRTGREEERRVQKLLFPLYGWQRRLFAYLPVFEQNCPTSSLSVKSENAHPCHGDLCTFYPLKGHSIYNWVRVGAEFCLTPNYRRLEIEWITKVDITCHQQSCRLVKILAGSNSIRLRSAWWVEGVWDRLKSQDRLVNSLL